VGKNGDPGCARARSPRGCSRTQFRRAPIGAKLDIGASLLGASPWWWFTPSATQNCANDAPENEIAALAGEEGKGATMEGGGGGAARRGPKGSGAAQQKNSPGQPTVTKIFAAEHFRVDTPEIRFKTRWPGVVANQVIRRVGLSNRWAAREVVYDDGHSRQQKAGCCVFRFCPAIFISAPLPSTSRPRLDW